MHTLKKTAILCTTLALATTLSGCPKQLNNVSPIESITPNPEESTQEASHETAATPKTCDIPPEERPDVPHEVSYRAHVDSKTLLDAYEIDQSINDTVCNLIKSGADVQPLIDKNVHQDKNQAALMFDCASVGYNVAALEALVPFLENNDKITASLTEQVHGFNYRYIFDENCINIIDIDYILKDSTRRNEFLRFCKQMIQAGSDFDIDVQQAVLNDILSSSLNTEKFELAEEFIKEFGIDINDEEIDGNTILSFHACDAETVRFLVKLGASPNTQDTNGHTPLMNAVDWGDLECVKLLIEMGADVNETSYRAELSINRTALSHAFELNEENKNRAEIIKVLIQSGAKVRLEEFKEAYNYSIDTEEILLDAGAPKEDVERAIRYLSLDIYDVNSVKAFFKDYRLEPDFFIAHGPCGIDYKKAEKTFIQAGIPKKDIIPALYNGLTECCRLAEEQGEYDSTECTQVIDMLH